ncbi:MAG: O-acetyl-ADP-ribose deacetylase [Gammaproteobacteria bacterium]|nr:MAG: O-acetyl-ADP-ribose deacetylase [Gammaproteobacteria bacterium]
MDRVEVVVGDITQLAVDAVVNAANAQLAGGGGVDGAIHRAAGYQQLQQACRSLGGCPTGQVKMTPGFNLPAKYIFHAVGPIWHGGRQGEDRLLADCYRNAMALAAELGIDSIAFPSISCGVYGYPADLAVVVAVDEVRRALQKNSALKKVVFCCFDRHMAELYQQHLHSRLGGPDKGS